MVVGVNGVGKTTTIGKLAYQFKKEGYNVVLGAADTFRAAAIDQLQVWADRVGVPLVKQQMGSDAFFFPHRRFGASPFALAAISLSLRPCMADSACPGAPSSGSPKARPWVFTRSDTDSRNSPSHSDSETPAFSAERRARLRALSAARWAALRSASNGLAGGFFAPPLPPPKPVRFSVRSRRAPRGTGQGSRPLPAAWPCPVCGCG